jgi:diacylglycerol kinase
LFGLNIQVFLLLTAVLPEKSKEANNITEACILITELLNSVVESVVFVIGSDRCQVEISGQARYYSTGFAWFAVSSSRIMPE